MINNITGMDLRPQMSVAKATPSVTSMSMPAILGFKTPQLKEKATIRVKKIKRGDIYYANLNPVIGSEQSGTRPVLIVQNDTGNRYSPTTIAAAITSHHKNDLPTHIT